MSRFTNPFYGGSNANAPAPANGQAASNQGDPPPAYSRPVPAAPAAAPVTYSSLSDLTKGRAPAPPPRPAVTSQSSFGQGRDAGRDSGRDSSRDSRRVPPPPSNYGVPAPMEPPRRNVPERTTDTPPPPPSRFAQAQKTAGGYIPNSVSATATSVGDRMKEGYDSLTTQQRREQVAAGAGKVAAGAAKLAGKAAWQLGKFASGSKT